MSPLPKNKFRLSLSELSDVIIYPFFECNLNCIGCPVHKPSKEVGFLSCPPNSFKEYINTKYLDVLTSWVFENVIILGGEPFLSSSLPTLLKTLERSGANIIVYTNATLLYNVPLKKLAEVIESIDRIVISLEGGQDWTDRIRGVGTYEKAKKVISKLSLHNYNVAVRMSYFEDNLISVIKEIEELDANSIPVILFPRLDKPPLSIEVADYFYSAVSSFDKVDIILPSYKNYIGSGEGVCPAGWAKVCVMPDGRLTPCQWINTTIAHIEWRDKDIEGAFTRWCSRNFDVKDLCLGCKYAFTCRSGCRASLDYLCCPVKKGLGIRERKVMLFGSVRVIDHNKISKLKQREGASIHGCSAGC